MLWVRVPAVSAANGARRRMPRSAGRARRSRPGPARAAAGSGPAGASGAPRPARRIWAAPCSHRSHLTRLAWWPIKGLRHPACGRAGRSVQGLISSPGRDLGPGYPRHKGRWSCGSVSIGAGAVCPCASRLRPGRAGSDRGRGGERAGRDAARMLGARQLRPRSARSRSSGSCRRLGPLVRCLAFAGSRLSVACGGTGPAGRTVRP